MHLQLHDLCLELQSPDEPIRRQWRQLFEGWLAPAGKPAGPPDIILRLTGAPQLPPLPEAPPYFSDAGALPRGPRILSVYAAAEGQALLHYQDGALVTAPLAPAGAGSVPVVEGVITPRAMRYGRFEDITFTSLAPLLRRRGYYLAHAFAAAREEQCVLIVGPSQSGKTTTGLSLLLAGWELLANDVVLLHARPDGVYALATPGDIGIRPGSFDLLPGLRAWVAASAPGAGQGGEAINIAGQRLVNGRWAAPHRVSALFAPQISGQAHSWIRPLPRAVALARLMEESIDRWDQPTLRDHVNVLEAICRQAHTFTLHLGQDVAQIALRLSSQLAQAP